MFTNSLDFKDHLNTHVRLHGQGDFARRQAEEMHALVVFDPLRDSALESIKYAEKLSAQAAQHQLRHGAARRLLMTWRAYRVLIFGVPANRTEPIPRDDLETYQRDGDAVFVDAAITLARPRNATAILASASMSERQPDRTLVRAIALARSWAKQLEAGEIASVVDLAAAQKRCIHYTNKLLPLAYLAPDLIELVLAGRQPRTLTLSALLAEPLPLDWAAQRAWMNRFT